MCHHSRAALAPLLCLSLTLAWLPARAEDVPDDRTLPPVVVEEEGLEPDRLKDNVEAEEEMRRAPGGVALVPDEQIERTRAAAFEDVLEAVPGVLVRARGTGEEPQLSIRGSGLRNNFHTRGVNVLLDGFPFQNADGFSDVESFEFLALERVEVWKGVTSLRYGGNALGGALNLVTRTARSAEPLRLRSEGGAFGFSKSFASSGFAAEAWDGFAAISHTQQDGYRDHADQNRQRLYASFARKLEGGAELRLDANGVRNRQELPGALTRDEFHDDPSQANPSSAAQDEARDFELGRGALSLVLPLGETTRLEWNGQLHYQDLWHPLAFGIIDNETWNGSTELRLAGAGRALGLDHAWESGLQLAYTQQPQEIHENQGGERGPTSADLNDQRGEVWNLTGYLGDELALTEALSLVGGTRVQLSERQVDDNLANRSDERSDVFVTPALGFVWRFAEAAELYGGAGRIVEPPVLFESTAPGNLDGDLESLDPQTAWSFEIGARGAWGDRLRFDLAVYDMEIRDEIRNINVDPTGMGLFTIPRYENIDRTRHWGVEAGLEALLARDLLAALGPGDTLHASLSYALGRNTFVDDDEFGGNDLPGAPRHLFYGALRWRHPCGFWVAPAVEVAAGEWYADSENLVEVSSSTLVHLRVGYDHERSGLSGFLELRNLADEEFVSAVVVDSDDGRYIEPGDGRGVFVGLEWRWR
jgi:iron complex outermembrane receptor protein